GDRLIGVSTCTVADDVLLAARGGRCIRFPVDDVRVFSGRTSTGVRGIRLSGKDQVISLSVLHHMAAETAEREAYLRHASAVRRGARRSPVPRRVNRLNRRRGTRICGPMR